MDHGSVLLQPEDTAPVTEDPAGGGRKASALKNIVSRRLTLITQLGSNKLKRNSPSTEVLPDCPLFYKRHFLDQGLHFSRVEPN